jgi:hypothetical protein
MKNALGRIGLTLVVLISLLALGSPAQATPFNGAGFYYAGGSQTFTGTDYVRGLSANVLVTKPFVPNVTSGGVYDHSLIDLVISETTSGVAGNAVEAGIAVNPNVWGDFNPHLFGCAWSASVAYGCWTGGTAFVDNGGYAVNLGSDLTADIGPLAKQLQVYWSNTACGADASGVFITYAGTSVGCFKQSTFSGGYSTNKFVQAFGEYHYNGANNPGTSDDKPCGDNGNGNTPAGSGSGAAYVGSLSIVNPSPGTLTTSFTKFTSTDSSAYDMVFATGSTRTFYYGGAGYKFVSGVATTPGNIGSC